MNDYNINVKNNILFSNFLLNGNMEDEIVLGMCVVMVEV